MLPDGEHESLAHPDCLLHVRCILAGFRGVTQAAAVETAYLSVLTRRPTPKERDYFSAKLTGLTGDERKRKLADLYWVLFNSTEMSWNK